MDSSEHHAKPQWSRKGRVLRVSLELGQCQPIGGEKREATNDKRFLRVTLPTRLQFGARTRVVLDYGTLLS